MHYYKFNISDWALHTAHLTLVEEAIYFRLINHYYDCESIIPLETQPVFRRLRLGSDSDIAEQILNEFFVKTNEGFLHNRCDKVLKEYRKTAKKNKSNGAKGGRPKKDGASSITQDKPSGLAVGTQVEPKHNPNYKPLTTNHKPLTNEKDMCSQASTAHEEKNELAIPKPKKTVKRFIKPTPAEVAKYCQDRKNFVAPESWINHYESNGWRVGKNPMKDWKAAVRTWEKNNYQSEIRSYG